MQCLLRQSLSTPHTLFVRQAGQPPPQSTAATTTAHSLGSRVAAASGCISKSPYISKGCLNACTPTGRGDRQRLRLLTIGFKAILDTISAGLCGCTCDPAQQQTCESPNDMDGAQGCKLALSRLLCCFWEDACVLRRQPTLHPIRARCGHFATARGCLQADERYYHGNSGSGHPCCVGATINQIFAAAAAAAPCLMRRRTAVGYVINVVGSVATAVAVGNIDFWSNSCGPHAIQVPEYSNRPTAQLSPGLPSPQCPDKNRRSASVCRHAQHSLGAVQAATLANQHDAHTQ